MLAHLLTSAIRSLAVTVLLGCILIYATGGLDSPYARAMVGVVAVCFFLFWITFVFMFGPRVPKYDSRRQDRDLDEAGSLPFRMRRRREHDDDSGHAADSGASGDAGGGD